MPIVTTPGQLPVTQTNIVADDAQNQDVTSENAVNSTNTPLQGHAPISTSGDQSTSVSGPSRIQSMKSSPPKIAKPTPILSDSTNMEDDDFFSDSPMPGQSNNSDKKGLSLSRMSEDIRKEVINKVFNSVLGRKPADRDYSYYRFSTLTEEGLTKSLLGLPEHTQMIDKAKEHKSLKQTNSDLDIRLREADQRVASMQQEVITLRQILEEKNLYIRQMRGGVAEPSQKEYVVENNAPVVNRSNVETTQERYSNFPYDDKAVAVAEREIKTLPTPWDEIKSLFASIFSRGK